MKRAGILSLILLAGTAFGVIPAVACQGPGEIPIQHNGRIKPFAAFAQETVQLISGKKSFQHQPAVSMVLGGMAHPERFLDLAFIRIDHPDLKKMLNLPVEKNYFSYHQVKPSFAAVLSLLQTSADKRTRDERPAAVEQQAETLYQRMQTVEKLTGGELITVIPAPEGQAWTSPFTTSGPQAQAFQQLVKDQAVGSPAVTGEITRWSAQVNAALPSGVPMRICLEALYYQVHPFFYAGWLYFLGFVLLLLARRVPPVVSGSVLSVGFLLHTAGLILRWIILSRPPVANMYETMIFMDWVLMVTVGIFVIFQKRRALLSSGAVISAFMMLYANLLPVDQSLDVLVPVLRSSYWLTIHVITIISSYSFFSFAMAVGHRHLFLSTRGNWPLTESKGSAFAIYRLLQIGLILLGAGTILGGVWANEAWGRFWGWDPKETWAFITFLGYMAILHLRYSKKLSDFALAVASLLGFLLVLMTWYGVNFVLGRGMHSYGAGSGGIIWIIYFLVAEAGFLAYVFKNRNKG